MYAADTEKLDQAELRLIERVESSVRNGYSGDAKRWSQTLVSIAMYRRLKAGLKGGSSPPEEG